MSSLCLAIVAGFLFFACGPQTEGPEEQKGDFSVKVHAVGADFVELEVQPFFLLQVLPQEFLRALSSRSRMESCRRPHIISTL